MILFRSFKRRSRVLGVAGSLLISIAALAQTANYQVNTFGPGGAYAGNNIYFEVWPVFSGTPANWTIQSVSFAGTPATDYQLICGLADCWKDSSGRYYTWNGSGANFRLRIPANLSAGTYNISMVSEANGAFTTTQIPVRVLAAPAPLGAPFLSSLAIPGLQKWESTYRTLGAKWCPAAGTTLSFGDESQVWYYDGARTYFQLADYTRDKSWENCALQIARQYRDYVNGANGGLPGWRNFTAGLRMAYERTGDPTFKQAVVLLSKNAAYAPYGGHIRDEYLRETAYVLNAYVEAERLGEPRNPLLSRAIDYILGHFDMLFVTGNYSSHFTFADGLGAEALINYYQLTKDARIPPVIKMMLDWTWDIGWNKSTYQLVYNPDPAGPKCPWGCQTYASELTNMVAPAFAWYWSVTGNPVYQQRGDEMFAHALDTDISYSAKIFNQNFRWSYNYTQWRTVGTSPACSYTVSPTSATVGANAGTVSFGVTASAPDCSWTASSPVTWATLAGTGSFTGSQTVTFNVLTNSASASRTTRLSIAGTEASLTQSGVACTYSLTPSSVSVPAAGGQVAFQVTASASDCNWNASSGVPWASVTSGGSGAGSRTVTYSVVANTSSARTGTVQMADKTATVTQAAGSADQTPPVISDVKAAVRPGGSVVITWKTDEPSTTQVEYGTTALDKASPLAGALTTRHSVTLDGLQMGATYSYRVLSRDGSGNLAVSPQMSFTALRR